MKKITLLLVVATLFSSCAGKDWKLIEPVNADYYDKKAESMMVPLRSCDYVAEFEFYGHLVKVAGMSKKIRRKITSYMPKIVMKKMVYNQQAHYDGYHKEEYYKYFLAQAPSGGYMQINYIFTDRSGNIITRSEKVYKPTYHQKFPSNHVIPRRCNAEGVSRYMRSFRDARGLR